MEISLKDGTRVGAVTARVTLELMRELLTEDPVGFAQLVAYADGKIDIDQLPIDLVEGFAPSDFIWATAKTVICHAAHNTKDRFVITDPFAYSAETDVKFAR